MVATNAIGTSQPSAKTSASVTPTATSTSTTTAWVFGDGDTSAGARALGDYMVRPDKRADMSVYVGDVYENGTSTEFQVWDSNFGRLASTMHPTIGDHEFANRYSGYYPYWRAKLPAWLAAYPTTAAREEALRHHSVLLPQGVQLVLYSPEHSATDEATWLGAKIAKPVPVSAPTTSAPAGRIVVGHKGRHVRVDTSHNDNTIQESAWQKMLGGRAVMNIVGDNHLYGRIRVSNVEVIVAGAGGHNMRAAGVQHHTVLAQVTGVPVATKLTIARGTVSWSAESADGRVRDSGSRACTPVRAA